jgi:Bacterial Ig domain
VTGAITVANSAALDFETTPSFTLTVQASDGTLSDTAAITVNLLNVNEAPTAGDDTAATTENTAVTTGNVLANDSDVDSVLSPASITAFDAVSANGGTVVNNGDGTFTYTPAANFNGIDTFTYTVFDGALSDVATVTITVTAANPVTTFFAPPLDWPPGPGSGPAPVPFPRLLGPPPVGVVMPVLPPPELVWSPGGQNSDAVLVADIVDIPDEPAAREAMLSRTFARVEQTNIVPQEPSDLPLEPPSLPVKKVLAVGHNLAERLTKLADNLDEAMQERERQSDLFGRVVTFSGIALSAGFVVWVLRGGSLLASFLVSMPAWRHFDPLPVLGSGKRDRKEHDRKAREEQENGQLRGLDQVLKSSEKPAKQQETDRAKRPKS